MGFSVGGSKKEPEKIKRETLPSIASVASYPQGPQKYFMSSPLTPDGTAPYITPFFDNVINSDIAGFNITEVPSYGEGYITLSASSDEWVDLVGVAKGYAYYNGGTGDNYGSLKITEVEVSDNRYNIPEIRLNDFETLGGVFFDVYGYGVTFKAYIENDFTGSPGAAVGALSPARFRVDESGNILNPGFEDAVIRRDYGPTLR